ncbi:lytic transglycosylase domain-containing protein [Haliangium ochraceum]|uniref:Lytic transglycosylase catalytic n=1 Tax=Haliangium ochraceum (strain DSM 14365 / JCM 11303 / SMP-2) TaxID=502025 RepID=D0LPW9_HALO1|nr:lytic transglycosylase domain-containing protein [Haliangium ochraceum]ACY17006.1 Lytic transglycosylase catalytic [Haliangium ochraceum DSM 14365]
MRRSRLRQFSLAIGALLLLAGSPLSAYADIYSYTDANGVVHFTNVAPSGKQRARWKKVLRESAEYGKAVARRGACQGCDAVPARDSSPERYARFDMYIHEAASLYKIPVSLIRAIIRVESDYDPRVVSSMDARGLMQLLPPVAEEMGVRNIHDPRENILGGTRLLRILANRYDGDLVLTIAAYQAGMGSLKKYNDSVPPYKNTRRYVRTVLDHYYRYKEREERERTVAER